VIWTHSNEVGEICAEFEASVRVETRSALA
jgi:hypothetical protein